MDDTVEWTFEKGEHEMAEVKDQELAPQTENLAEPAPAAAEPPKKTGGKWKNMPRKKRRKIIRWAILLVILAAAVIAGVKFLGGKGDEEAHMHGKRVDGLVFLCINQKCCNSFFHQR